VWVGASRGEKLSRRYRWVGGEDGGITGMSEKETVQMPLTVEVWQLQYTWCAQYGQTIGEGADQEEAIDDLQDKLAGP
jgi:hypothetical protein